MTDNIPLRYYGVNNKTHGPEEFVSKCAICRETHQKTVVGHVHSLNSAKLELDR